MKKPVKDYASNYPQEAREENYYGNCESGNNSCDTCNSGGNSQGSGNGSGGSVSVGSWN